MTSTRTKRVSTAASLSAAKLHNDSHGHSVIVVGAGIAGIAAARRLTDEGFDATVLEANPTRYGGRIYSFEVPGTGKAADMGAMWIHGGSNPDHPITQLCQHHGIETAESHLWKPGVVMAFDDQGRPLSAEEQEQILNGFMRLDEILETAKARLLDSSSADLSVRTLLDQVAKEDPDFVNQAAVQQTALPLLESYMAAVVDDLSVKFMYGVPNSPEYTEFVGEDLVIPSGYKTLLDKLVTAGPHFPILLDRRVEQISIDPDHSAIHVVSSDQRNQRYQHSADHVVIAVPLGVLKARSIQFEPSLSSAHLRAIDRIGFGNKVKVLLLYEEAFWPDVEVMHVRAKRWPVDYINLRRINGLNGLLTTLNAVNSNLADAMTDNAIVHLVIDRLTKLVGEEKMRTARLVRSKVIKWNIDQLSRGAYSFGKIGMRAEDAYAIRRPLSPYMFFAGEHTQFPEGEPGTVLAAYMSGQRAAEEIMALYQKDTTTRKVHFGVDKKALVSKL